MKNKEEIIRSMYRMGYYIWEIASVLDITESEVVKILKLQ